MRAIAGLATQPHRAHLLDQMLPRVAGQFHEIHVYWDASAPDRTPWIIDRLIAAGRRIVFHPRHPAGAPILPGVGDAGKFLPVWLGDVADDDLFFTLDDDILYPEDYVLGMRRHLAREHCVGLGGARFRKPFRDWYRDRDSWAVNAALEHLEAVHTIHTCTLATTGLMVNGLSPGHFKTNNASDLWFGLYAKRNGWHLSLVPREQNWVRLLPSVGIWEERKAHGHDLETKVVQQEWFGDQAASMANAQDGS